MKLNILHRANPTGESILNYFRQSWERVNTNEFQMDGHNYLEITAEQGRGPITLNINKARAFMNSVNNTVIEEILNLNGIPVSFLPSDLTNKTYDFLILDRSILSIRQTIYGKSAINKKYIEENQVSKIADLARRTMYLLGLDYAMISISINRSRKMKVSGVDASPTIRDKDLYDYIQKLEELKATYQDGWPEQVEIKLGADPEFMIANSKNGKMVPASEFFPRDGLFGCDNIRIPSRQQRPVAELRPKPETSPTSLYINIKQALEQANKKVPYRNIKWLAGSQPFNGYSTGGHIHFSNFELNNQSLRALDNYLGLPIFMIENQTTSIKRRNKYGQLGDFRIKDYGGFEYRTPGSWLISPEITLAVLCLAKMVSSNYRLLKRNYFITVEAQRAFYNGDQQYFKPYFEEIWSDIQRLDMYNEYKNHLEAIPNMIFSNLCWDEKLDIRKSWALSKVYNKTYIPPKQPSKATISNNTLNTNNNNHSTHNTTPRRPARSASTTTTTQVVPVAAIGSLRSSTNSFVRNNTNNYPGNYM